jgi:ribosomal protein S18 acetylase RimI-like enzyme
MTAAEEYALASLLATVADEFVPPLTVRNGTTQTELADIDTVESDSYFTELLRQDNLLAIDDGELMAFLSFRAGYHEERLPLIDSCIYVSTIAVHPEARGRGHARRLYERLLGLPEALPPWVVLRTWSTNAEHLKLLSSLGFDVLRTIRDDRGAGIDTLYLGRRRY